MRKHSCLCFLMQRNKPRHSCFYYLFVCFLQVIPRGLPLPFHDNVPIFHQRISRLGEYAWFHALRVRLCIR